MSSLDSLAQPEDQSTPVDISATQPPPPIGSDYEQLQMLETWLIIHLYREQRRFLEEFPAILNPRSEDLIKNTLTLESAGVPGQIQESHDHLTLLREIRTGVTLPQQFEIPIAALARAQVWLRNVTNQELQAWRATDFPELTVEDRHQTGSERPAFDPWQQEGIGC